MDKFKKVLILGAGGHGWRSLKYFFDKTTQTRIQITYLPADFGGSTGAIIRTFEANEFELNASLHGSRDFPLMPFGDLNKLVSAYLIDSDSSVHEMINFRSFDEQELLYEFGLLSRILRLDKVTIVDFEVYLKDYLRYFDNLRSSHPKLNYPTSLGNLWHFFLFNKFNGSIEDLAQFYKKLNVLQTNLELLFSSTRRLELIGFNQQNKLIIGEDKLDIQHSPILPETLDLISFQSEQIVADESFISALKIADLIILPNGSITNWLPLINTSGKIQSILKHKSYQNRLLWLTNLFRSSNEFEIYVYLEWLVSMDIKPVLLCPNKFIDGLPNAVERAYLSEGKSFNYSIDLRNSLRSHCKSLGIESLEDLNCIVGGNKLEPYSFKYDPQSIYETIISYFEEKQITFL